MYPSHAINFPPVLLLIIALLPVISVWSFESRKNLYNKSGVALNVDDSKIGFIFFPFVVRNARVCLPRFVVLEGGPPVTLNCYPACYILGLPGPFKGRLLYLPFSRQS
jgi:hypothetical protein